MPVDMLALRLYSVEYPSACMARRVQWGRAKTENQTVIRYSGRAFLEDPSSLLILPAKNVDISNGKMQDADAIVSGD